MPGLNQQARVARHVAAYQPEIRFRSENHRKALGIQPMTKITLDSADLIDARHSEWLDGFKSGCMFTLLISVIGIMVAGWIA